MGTTSEKLTYLNTTKEKIRDSINLTGANIGTSDTFRSYATKLKLGLIDIINNGTDTLYSNFPKVSGIGSNLSLTPTYEAPMKLNKIQGDTLQDGTPTPDSPKYIKVVTGKQEIKIQNKNLFNLTQNNTTYNNVTTQYKGSEFILNGTTSSSANIISPNSNTLFSIGTFEAGTYAFTLITNSGYNANNHSSAFYLKKSDLTSVKGHGIFANDNFTDTFILEEDTELFVQIYSNSGNIVFNDFHMYFQIEKGSTATSYEEYKGQNFELNLGKQLFNKDEIIANEQYLNKANVSDLMANDTGISWTATSNDSYIGLPAEITGGYGMLMKVNPNTSYTLSFDTNYELTLYAFYIASDYTFIQRNVPLGHNSGVSFTTPSNCEYIFIRFGAQNQTGNTINITNIQIEKGTKATPYSPYFTPIELCKIGTYQDYIYKSNGNWYLHKEIGTDIYIGANTENWTYYNGIIFIDNSKIKNMGIDNLQFFTNYFKPERLKCYISHSTGQRLHIRLYEFGLSNITNVGEWKNWLSTHNLEFKYILDTATDTLITNTELIEDLETLYTAKSQEGTTNISITSEDLEMILNVSALRGEV